MSSTSDEIDGRRLAPPFVEAHARAELQQLARELRPRPEHLDDHLVQLRRHEPTTSKPRARGNSAHPRRRPVRLVRCSAMSVRRPATDAAGPRAITHIGAACAVHCRLT